MKAKELMIDDWVMIDEPDKYAGAKAQIKTLIFHKEDDGQYFTAFIRDKLGIVRREVFNEDLRPIPLTAEILEKNGFELFSRDIKYITYCINVSQISVSYVKDTKEWMVFLGASGSVKKKFVEVSCVKYIHELQHALRLCGIEKEIEL